MRVKQARFWHQGIFNRHSKLPIFLQISINYPNAIFHRGAELIESLRRKQVKIQAQREEEILQKIKQKMDRIKANQQKLQPALAAPKTHYQGKYTVVWFLDHNKMRFKCSN